MIYYCQLFYIIISLQFSLLAGVNVVAAHNKREESKLNSSQQKLCECEEEE
jgi:hypothetical protein